MKKHNKGHTLSLCSLGNTAPHNECWLYCNMRAMNRDVSVGSISSLRVYCQPRTNRADTVDAHGANGEYDRCRRCLPDGQIVHVCPALFAKIFPFTFDPNHFYIYRHPGPDTEGRFAIVTDVGLGCDGRGWRIDEVLSCGRRSRVVLTPRRWRQVREKSSAR